MERKGNCKRSVEKPNLCSVLNKRPMKIARQNVVQCICLCCERLHFVTLNGQPEETQLGAIFPSISMCCCVSALHDTYGVHITD